MNIATKQVDKVILRGAVLKNIKQAKLYRELKKTIKENIDAYFDFPWIAFSSGSEKGWYNRERELAVPVALSYGSSFLSRYFGIINHVMSHKEVVTLFNKKSCPNEIMKAIMASKSYEERHYISFDKGSYCIEENEIVGWSDGDSVHIGTVRIKAQRFKEIILSGAYELRNNVNMKETIALISNKKIEDLNDDTVDKLVKLLNIDRKNIEIGINRSLQNDFKLDSDTMEMFTEELLACDTNRADLEKYDRKCIEDVNSGHWELWESNENKVRKGQLLASLEKPLVARNPAADIHYDGLIGIDFGTKSTIVSKQDGTEKTNLLRIGIGRLNKIAEASHYENPTIMEFINLDKFMTDYRERVGRPFTSVKDLNVSHGAEEDLKNCDKSEDFYSFFYDIKQWCGDTERNVRIIDQNGKERVLPSFVSLNNDQFNPLELYAYYLGLYINNMRESNGIYLDYVLSFPVTYEKKVKEKILESFTKGLKKSLPDAILNNPDIMKKFRVRQGVSEPAAYAITALQGYAFDPDEDENVLYSVFDFGGGTTDFDFGLWRCAGNTREEERYDYVIEHFCSEGDKYLGGENLLELLAYEIFKANAKLLQKKKEDKSFAGYSFTKPKECDNFPGSETLISSSQEARRNTKQLMEALRPFWEGIIGIERNNGENTGGKAVRNTRGNAQKEKIETISYNGYIFKSSKVVEDIVSNGYVSVDLFDKDGNSIKDEQLYVSNVSNKIDVNLVKILEERIERGVSNFFDAIMLAFRNEPARKSGVNDIQIFLAGNSSKSPILKKIFDQYISKMNADIKNKKNTDGNHFHLYPPLGTEEAIELQKKRGINVNSDDITAPTGKTGVAYGLIAGRDGGTIKVISESTANAQAKFRYNIGTQKRGKFRMVLDRNEVVYGKWERFTIANAEDFEIYYTSLPSAGNMSITDQGIYKKRCRISNVDPDADVYIRAIEESPNDIEYVVSKSDHPAKNAKIVRIHLDE